jgi:hypothetical protein
MAEEKEMKKEQKTDQKVTQIKKTILRKKKHTYFENISDR